MKDTDHRIRHPRVHRGDRVNAEGSESYARQNSRDGRGMAPCWAGATPLFASVPWPKDHWGRSSPTRRFLRYARRELRRSFLRALLNSRGEERFTSVLQGTLHRALHRSAVGKVRQVNTIDASKTIGLRAGWHDVRAGATPPFDARCVTVAVWSLPPSQKLRVRVLRGPIHRPENLSDKRTDTLYENERRSPLAILKSPPS